MAGSNEAGRRWAKTLSETGASLTVPSLELTQEGYNPEA